MTVAKRLLEKVRATYNGMIDGVVYNALSCNSIWINQCIDNKMTPVIHVKENNICSIKEVKRAIGVKRCKEIWYDGTRSCDVKAHEEKSFEMDGVKV